MTANNKGLNEAIKIICILIILSSLPLLVIIWQKYHLASYDISGYLENKPIIKKDMDYIGLLLSELICLLNIAISIFVLMKRKLAIYLLAFSFALAILCALYPSIAITRTILSNILLAVLLFLKKDGISGWKLLLNKSV